MLSRRSVLGLTAGALSGLIGPGLQASVRAATDFNTGFQAWLAWRAVHMDPSGRVIDNLQDGISHSEGQGYAMVLASAFNDHSAFEALWNWTRNNLQKRSDDKLIAWKWDPASPDAPADINNASDGDLFVAWGLLRGAQTFGNQSYLDAARAIAADLDRVCIKPMPGRPDWAILIPGAHGFMYDGSEKITMNLSYAFHRPMRALAREFDLPRIELASATNRAIVDRMCEFGLPPDWLDVWPTGMAPPEERPAVYGYEALRIPLFEIWSGRPSAPVVRRAAELYARDIEDGGAVGGTPTRAELAGQHVLEWSRDPGYAALRSATMCSYDTGVRPTGVTPFDPNQNYYPATLHMLAMVAGIEAGLECVSK